MGLIAGRAADAICGIGCLLSLSEAAYRSGVGAGYPLGMRLVAQSGAARVANIANPAGVTCHLLFTFFNQLPLAIANSRLGHGASEDRQRDRDDAGECH